MIASLRDTVLNVGLTNAVVEIGGADMSIQVTPITPPGLRAGEETLAHTEMVIREDSLTLFGFADIDGKDSSRTLISVKGVGAKLALAMLAIHTPSAFRWTIASQDVAILTRVPGLGPKDAQRVILDMADKPDPVTGDGLGATQTAAQSTQGMEMVSGNGPEPYADVIAALVQLG